MNNKLNFKDLGLVSYDEVFNLQKKLFNEKIVNKNRGLNNTNDILICQHHHVYTLGKSGDVNNLLINDVFLSTINATYFKTDRGGDITYHGPGQLVVYPIIDFDNFNIGVKDYIYKLEYLVIDVLKEYGIQGEISDGNIGVWLDVGTVTERKICSIGVKVSRGITMHGLALNVNTDLSYFNHINPCGFTDKAATSIENEIGVDKVSVNEVSNYLKIKMNLFFRK